VAFSSHVQPPSTTRQTDLWNASPDTEDSHHVPRGPTVDSGTSPGSPRNPHDIQRVAEGISSCVRVWRAPRNPWRATSAGYRLSGPSASHHRAPPAYGSPQTSSSSTPRLLVYIREQRPREVHPHLPPSGHNTLSFGTAAPTRSCHGGRRQ
jgi:hypothetical protein